MNAVPAIFSAVRLANGRWVLVGLNPERPYGPLWRSAPFSHRACYPRVMPKRNLGLPRRCQCVIGGDRFRVRWMILDQYEDRWQPVPEGAGCHVWTGRCEGSPASPKPAVWFDGKSRLVSRLVCKEAYGPPPTPKHEVCHATLKGCIGSLCVRREHLRWGTHQENMADRTPAAISSAARRGRAKQLANQTPEQRKAIGQKTLATKRRKGTVVARTHEQLSRDTLKAWVTRRRNLASASR